MIIINKFTTKVIIANTANKTKIFFIVWISLYILSSFENFYYSLAFGCLNSIYIFLRYIESTRPYIYDKMMYVHLYWVHDSLT